MQSPQMVERSDAPLTSLRGYTRVIWNPRSGRKAGLPTNGTTEDVLRDLMARHSLGKERTATENEDEPLVCTRDAVAAGYRVVVAVGGDGTVNTVASALLQTHTARRNYFRRCDPCD